MRYQFTLALILTLFFSGWYYYRTADPCVVPLTYALGSIDTRFNLSNTEVTALVTNSAKVWEEAVGRSLFVYDPAADFKINFIFDERQEKSNRGEVVRRTLDATAVQSSEINRQYEALVVEYDILDATYNKAVIIYDDKLEVFNATVASYNEAGGASEEDFNRLQAIKKDLESEEKNLAATASKLARVSKEINAVSEQGNALVAEYNTNVSNFNQTYTGAGEFTQGDYTGSAINVYHFGDISELKNVVAHEFGHALGLPHVDDEASIMYYLMDKQPATSRLSENDLAALQSACKPNESVSHRVHRFFSSLFIKLQVI